MTRSSTRRTAVVRGQREMYSRVVAAHALAALRHQRTWFKVPALKAARVPWTADQAAAMERLVPGSYGWAKQAAHRAADAEHWADTELHRPASSLNHRTARFAGKPYHWRQDYTGQLKLAAGESPW